MGIVIKFVDNCGEQLACKAQYQIMLPIYPPRHPGSAIGCSRHLPQVNRKPAVSSHNLFIKF